MEEPEQFKCPYKKGQTECEELFDSEEEASIHRILDHSTEPVHMRADRQILCHYSRNFGKEGCQETFTTVKDALEHLQSVHSEEKEPLTCPISNDCTSDCTSHDGLRNHVEHKHRITAQICTQCGDKFGSRSSVVRHQKEAHAEGPNRIVCPRPGCKKSFVQKQSLDQHIKTAHDNIRYQCTKCVKSYATPGSLRQHTRSKHDNNAYKCPFDDCDKEIGDASGLTKHLKKKHPGRNIPCPLDDCDQEFPNLAILRKHKQIGHANQYPCRSEGCTKLFGSQEVATQHYEKEHYDKQLDCRYCHQVFSRAQIRRTHEMSHTHNFSCPRLWCSQRFETWKEAFDHGLQGTHDFDGTQLFTCPLENCRIAVTGRSMLKSELKRHWETIHVKYGHVDPQMKLVPVEAGPLPFEYSPLLERIFEYNATHVSNHNVTTGQSSGTPVEDDGLGNAHNTSPPEDQTEIDMTKENLLLPSEGRDLNLEGQIEVELSPEAYQALIEAQNEQYWNDRKHQGTDLSGIGHICAGPGTKTRHFIREPCPKQARIGFGTARLRQRQLKQGTRLITFDHECVDCHPIKRLRTLMDCQNGDADEFDLEELEQLFLSTLKRKWPTSPAYLRVVERMNEIERGERPGTDLIVFDTEFTLASHQVMEFAAVERVSGNTVINTLLTHKEGIRHYSATKDLPDETILFSRIHAAGVYASSRTLGRMDVGDLAAKIYESGINQDTLMLAWHNYDQDLLLLREYLASANQGYENLLPPPENCIPLIQFFRDTLRQFRVGADKKLYPLKLEILFHVLFPRSSLVGRNHQALVDSQQTKIMLDALDWLRKPVNERGTKWETGGIHKPANYSIKDFFSVVGVEDIADRADHSELALKKRAKSPGSDDEAPLAHRAKRTRPPSEE